MLELPGVLGVQSSELGQAIVDNIENLQLAAFILNRSNRKVNFGRFGCQFQCIRLPDKSLHVTVTLAKKETSSRRKHKTSFGAGRKPTFLSLFSFRGAGNQICCTENTA